MVRLPLGVGAQLLDQRPGREHVVAHRTQAVLGIAGDGDRIVVGLFLKTDDAPVLVDLDDAELVRLRLLDRQAGDGRDRPLLEVEVGHLADVHLVDVVGAEHEHRVRPVLLDQVQVLEDRVGRAPVPGFAHAHLRRHDGHEGVERAARPPGSLHVLGQRLRLVLGQHVDRPDARVGQVRQHEVDDPVAAPERNGGFGAIERERKKSRAFAACHHQRDEPLLSVHRIGTATITTFPGGT